MLFHHWVGKLHGNSPHSPELDSSWLFLGELHSCIARFRFASRFHSAIRNQICKAKISGQLPVPNFCVSA